MLNLRPSPIAGTWYEADPKKLAIRIDEYLSAVRLPTLTGEVMAIIAPHAGHIYSGAVAAYAFATLRDLTPDLIIIICLIRSSLPNMRPTPRPSEILRWIKLRSPSCK